jgi:hypothetical protein
MDRAITRMLRIRPNRSATASTVSGWAGEEEEGRKGAGGGRSPYVTDIHVSILLWTSQRVRVIVVKA